MKRNGRIETHVENLEAKELKIIYPDVVISDEAKAAFSSAYKDLETAYKNLKSNLDKYLSAQKAKHN